METTDLEKKIEIYELFNDLLQKHLIVEWLHIYHDYDRIKVYDLAKQQF